MKTKLTLFVAVIAVTLFGMGCASTKNEPPVPHAVKWNGHWYAYFPEGCNWETAIKKCERLGGHLAYAETKEENDFLLSLYEKSKKVGNSQGVWLGGTDKKNEGDWVWLSGKPITTPLWGDGEPNNRDGIQHYMFMQVAGEDYGAWGDLEPTGLFGVFCEWE
tara:strand:+ start:356 stop:841 length:486 start_codon:yes stop_codon:yes gene_type:complete